MFIGAAGEVVHEAAEPHGREEDGELEVPAHVRSADSGDPILLVLPACLPACLLTLTCVTPVNLTLLTLSSSLMLLSDLGQTAGFCPSMIDAKTPRVLVQSRPKPLLKIDPKSWGSRKISCSPHRLGAEGKSGCSFF